jgi:hypothetical protein
MFEMLTWQPETVDVSQAESAALAAAKPDTSTSDAGGNDVKFAATRQTIAALGKFDPRAYASVS